MAWLTLTWDSEPACLEERPGMIAQQFTLSNPEIAAALLVPFLLASDAFPGGRWELSAHHPWPTRR